MNVDDLMTKDVVAIGPEASLKAVANLLVEHDISGLPVIGDQAQVLGVISETDLAIKVEGPEPDRGHLLGRLTAGNRERQQLLGARTASEAMSTPPITIDRGAPISAAARLMGEHSLKRLPVVEQGRLVGIVTRADLMRVFARSDSEIEAEIRADVIKRGLWLSPDRVRVTVRHGEVELEGRVETRLEAELVPKVVQRVPGVVAVRSRITWESERRRVA
jgi:CBS-domain-containing membrane protein